MTTFSISELASEFNITTRTIRFYEEKGLLTPQRKGQTRIFSSADRVKLKLILRGKRLGFSLQESASIIAMYDPEHGNREQLQRLLDTIREKQQQLAQQQKDIQSLLEDLQEAENNCLASMA